MRLTSRSQPYPSTAPRRRRPAVTLSRMPRLGPTIVCCSVALVAGCRAASSPHNVAGVRAMYRSIGIDASSGNFRDICESYMDEQLRNELQPLSKNCFTRRFERWAEGVRLSKVGSGTRIVVSEREALVLAGRSPKGRSTSRASGAWEKSRKSSCRSLPPDSESSTGTPIVNALVAP